MIITLAISGYRSIRNLVLPLERLNVVTGANGSGKSNLYRSIKLLADVSQGSLLRSLAVEGGLDSILWAGPETLSQAMKRGDTPVQGTIRRDRIALKLGCVTEDFGYAIDLGMPQQFPSSLFNHDPEIKTEAVWYGEFLRRSNILAERRGPAVTLLQKDNKRRIVNSTLANFDSMMTHSTDPEQAPELVVLRDRMRNWRFYDHFRSDGDAPARMPQIATRTPVLSSDGKDVAAAMRTIMEIGDGQGFSEAIDDAFPGSKVVVEIQANKFEASLVQPGMLRPLKLTELSDGTLRFLLLATALMTPRPPELMVLNEPETSLHSDLIPALARLISKAAIASQIIVVTHDPVLLGELTANETCHMIELSKELGETVVKDCTPPNWNWPKR